MAFGDGATLGFCFGRIDTQSHQEKKKALSVYEGCRMVRAESTVARGGLQQDIYHCDDGPEQ